MNILFLCDEYPPCMHGGIGTVTQTLARELAERGNEVTVCGFYPYFRKSKHSETDRGVRILRYHYGNRFILKLSRHRYLGRIVNIRRSFRKYIINLQQIIRENNIELIEIPDFNEVFRISGPRFISFPDFGIPYIVKIHGSYTHLSRKANNFHLIHKKEQTLIDKAEALIAISKYSKQYVRENFNPGKDIHVIHNGLKIPPSITGRENPENKIVVFAGSISGNKGIPGLLKAWEEINRVKPDTRLYLYGKGNSEYVSKIKNNFPPEMKDSIEFKGFVTKDTLLEIYRVAACAVFPSFNENLSMAPIEAMSVGCPTIFTKLTSGPEIINHGVDGILVNPDHVSDIRDSIIYLLENPAYAKKLGAKGREKVMNKFDIRNVTDRHLAFYSKIIFESRHG